MADFVIHKLSWHLKGDVLGQKVVEGLVIAYKPLISWLSDRNLFLHHEFARKQIDEEFEIRVSDLTDVGFELFKLTHDRWLKALDRVPTGTLTESEAIKKVETIWQKQFAKMQNEI